MTSRAQEIAEITAKAIRGRLPEREARQGETRSRLDMLRRIFQIFDENGVTADMLADALENEIMGEVNGMKFEQAFYTRNEVAALLHVKPGTVRAWNAAGKLGFVRLGRSIRITAEQLTAFVKEHNAEE